MAGAPPIARRVDADARAQGVLQGRCVLATRASFKVVWPTRLHETLRLFDALPPPLVALALGSHPLRPAHPSRHRHGPLAHSLSVPLHPWRRPYLSASHFVKVGLPASVAMAMLTATIGYGMTGLVF